MNNEEFGALAAVAFQMLVKRVPLDDAERIAIAELHAPWKQQAYGASEYVRYGQTAAGRAQLWMSVNKVQATAPAPDVPVNPQNWKKL